MFRRRYIPLFQQGGVTVYGAPTQVPLPSINAGDNVQIFQAANTPLQTGIQDYLGLENLQIQRDENERKKEEFKYKIKEYEANQLAQEMKFMTTIRHDFTNLEVDAEDAERYSQLVNQYIPQSLRDCAAKGDVNCMRDLARSANSLMFDPNTQQIVGKHQRTMKDIDAFAKMSDEQKSYVRNIGDVQNAILTGKAIPAIDFDQDSYNKYSEESRKGKLLETQNKAAVLEGQAQEQQRKNMVAKAYEQAEISDAMNTLGITGDYNSLSDEDKNKVNTQRYQPDIQLKRQELALKQATANISMQKLEILNRELTNGTPPEMALQIAGIEKVDADNLIKLQILRDKDLTTQQKLEKLQGFNDKHSSVNFTYNTANGTPLYMQQGKDGDRQYDSFITDNNGVNIKNLKVNGTWVDIQSLPNEIRAETDGQGRAYIIISAQSKAADNFLKQYYGFDVTDGFPDWDYSDILKYGRTPMPKGTVGNNYYLKIPIHNEDYLNKAYSQSGGTTNNQKVNVTPDNAHTTLPPRSSSSSSTNVNQGKSGVNWGL